MIKRKLWGLLYILIVLGTLAAAEWGCRTVSVMVEAAPLKRGNCIIIDAGHGGEDGGATSCRGILESTYNLEISLRLNDLFHLLGYDTRMIRTTDTSIYTKGETIAQKKISDLKERVRIVNKTENALLLSIHQNNFTDSRYSGAQVFYAGTEGSAQLAKLLQERLVSTLNPGTLQDIMLLAPAMLSLKDAEIEELRLPVDGGYKFQTVRGMSVIVPDRTMTMEAIADFLNED